MNLTDDEIRDVSMKAAAEYVRRVGNGVMNPEECLDAELAAVKAEYKKKNRIGSGRPLTGDDIEQIAQAFMRLKPELAEKTRRKLISRKKSQKTAAIGVATTRALISGLLDQSGLKHEVYYQKYRVKLVVYLERNSACVLHIHYKDIIGKDLSGLVPALNALNAVVVKK